MAITLPRFGLSKKEDEGTKPAPSVQSFAPELRDRAVAPQPPSSQPSPPPPRPAPSSPPPSAPPPVQRQAPAAVTQGSRPKVDARKYGTAQEEMFKILSRSQEVGSSDILFSVGLPPMFRVAGSLIKDKFPVLTPDILKRLVYSILRTDQISYYEKNMELDLSLSVPGVARFRINVYRQKKCVSAAFRSINENIPSFEDLQLGPAIRKLALLGRGLVLVTGPTGSGKSSTLAAMINLINETTSAHIITVEDPIEFVHQHKKCVIDQRELKTDTESFPTALKYVLRQNPDIILVGEMRDLDTISAAISAAETGHLVFSTLHTQDSAQTVDRIIDVFPAYQQEQIRAQLATTLKGIVSQQLLPKKGGGRVAAREILIVTPAIANLIREGKSYNIPNAIQTGANLGMITLDMHLSELLNKGIITWEDAMSKAVYPEQFKSKI